jgi:alanyl-tRNA synthetase
MIMQGKPIIFETDLFAPLVDRVFAFARRAVERRGIAMRDARVIADHTRGLTFAIAEGALPGNEGAGYVLRRLVRRAVARAGSRQGLAIDLHPILPDVAEVAIGLYGGHYRELEAHLERVKSVLAQEETSFAQTYAAGFSRLEALIGERGKSISGQDAFVLHDTYGFPIELTEEIARERGVTVDRPGFERAMEGQRERARAASRFTKGGEEVRRPWTVVSEGPDSEFLGYETLSAEGVTLRRWRAAEGGDLELVLDRTPFYAESGGQVADRGRLEGTNATAELTHVYKEDDHIVHRVRLARGDAKALVAEGEAGRLRAAVDPAQRFPTMRHHTATHLLHAALRKVLGTHVRQAGSLVAPDRLRFDYTHFEAPAREQLAEIERMVMEWILRNREVSWAILPIEEAKAQGAMALFGEKYGAQVRVVLVPGVEDAGIPTSRELCGGTHVTRTGDIGAFVLVSDAAIASGVRRIEALCGHQAIDYLRGQSELLHRAAGALQSSPAALPEQVEKLRAENERLRKAQSELQRGGLEAEMGKLVEGAVTESQGRWVVGEIAAEADVNAVREAADRLRGKLERGAAVLALKGDGKLMFLAAVTDDLISEKRLRADELVRAVAKVTGGSGGGKPHLALAGGKDAGKLGDALAEARRLLQSALST